MQAESTQHSKWSPAVKHKDDEDDEKQAGSITLHREWSLAPASDTQLITRTPHQQE